VSDHLGLALFRRATQVGFGKLTADELQHVVHFQEAQLRALADLPAGVDRKWRAALHVSVRDLAGKTLARRRAA
jgi:hypothetical protein